MLLQCQGGDQRPSEESRVPEVAMAGIAYVATKDQPCTDFPLKHDGGDHPAVILDLESWVLVPR